ncbi:MAG TPA: NlpC/P60 family protein [Trebonia sp.]|nr:NlpC/P60 family protein [Trebonia sp.]
MNRKAIGSAGLGVGLIVLLFFLAIPMLVIGGISVLFAGGGASGCSDAPAQSVAQPPISSQGKNSIPATYLHWYQKVGLQYNIPWTILAGIGTEESENGQSTLPGVHSGANAFGAAGPMQIGIYGASTNTWGGAPVHAASQVVSGVATDEDGDGQASVYEPADAIAGAAKYLNAHGFASDPSGAIFAYNHAGWYVSAVENFASEYASGGYVVSQVDPDPAQSAGGCTGTVLDALTAPNIAVATAVKFAEAQIGKPYLFGGTGPDAFDCSGLVMMAYRQAGIDIPRTSSAQWAWGPKVDASAASPGDLVFFAGSDGTTAAPGHVALVIGKNTMIEAYATGFPLRVSKFGNVAGAAPGDGQVVGFTRPWANTTVKVPAGELATPTPTAPVSPSGTPASGQAPATPPGRPAKGGQGAQPPAAPPQSGPSKKA